MLETVAFLILAYILLRLPAFDKTRPEDKLVCWSVVLHSMLDDGPFEWRPGAYKVTDPGNTDPNSNPHYIWAEQDQE